MLRSWRQFISAAIIAVLSFPVIARGNLVTFEFEAVSQAFVDNHGLGWTIPNGTSVSGRVTFESTTPDDNPDRPDLGRYFDCIVASNMQIGEYATTDTGLDSFIAITTGFSNDDTYQMIDRSLSFRGVAVSAGIVLIDSDATAFDDVLLPITPPPLDEFEGRLFSILADDDSFSALGTLTSLTLVPEPSTLLLLVGATLLARRPRR